MSSFPSNSDFQQNNSSSNQIKNSLVEDHQKSFRNQGNSEQSELKNSLANTLGLSFDQEVSFNPGDCIANRYEVIQFSGHGGMGVIYKIKDLILNEVRALKTISPKLNTEETFRLRFFDEVKVATRLSHPNILRVHDIGQTDTDSNMLFLTMEWIEGKSLRQILIEQESLDWKQAHSIFLDITRALKYAHEQNILHLDLKPENIMLDGSNNAKIVDFGLAKAIGQQRLKLSGRVGTFDYMAPEVYEQRIVNKKSDIFSLGVLFYEVLTGKVPFGTPESIETNSSKVPKKLEETIFHAMQQDPSKRLSNVEVFEDILMEINPFSHNKQEIKLKPSLSEIKVAPQTPTKSYSQTGQNSSEDGYKSSPFQKLGEFAFLLLFIVGFVVVFYFASLFVYQTFVSDNRTNKFETHQEENETLQKLFSNRYKSKNYRLVLLELKSLESEKKQKLIPTLILALKDQNKDIRYRASIALAYLGGDCKEAVPDLVQALKDDYLIVRGRAIEALVKIGKQHPRTVLELIESFPHEDTVVQSGLLSVFGKIGDASKSAIPLLIQSLESSSFDICCKAAQILGEIRAYEAIPYLKKKEKEANEGLRLIIREALDKLQ